ncbi:short neurotoxin 8 [Oncorhynchus tshawytscha]|uniref:short neurotoxin 8 n=1 Tax=Oncorhynchus tshawytscha TaxID=74940 RepID=UPI000D09CC99|nr:short neurotoxin 8 [Oncorhynchus tshawytscha]
MRTLLLTTMLLVLLCNTQVLTLRCYTCEEDDADCKQVTECPPSSMFCRTVVTADTVTRTCEEMCVSGVNAYCCQGDLCEN